MGPHDGCCVHRVSICIGWHRKVRGYVSIYGAAILVRTRVCDRGICGADLWCCGNEGSGGHCSTTATSQGSRVATLLRNT
ncbi:hypothetical protein DEO72_LG8g2516 [Vigna unguiculata]|uniref:Uncharacterized protein n=1 Tax=Vigna unguiculata TaxID=3917 RepID=A0A4D6MSI5_VIGUN|nr:hypothetical protein DEO72_LG8g2516 [Vigna unguiculata]